MVFWLMLRAVSPAVLSLHGLRLSRTALNPNCARCTQSFRMPPACSKCTQAYVAGIGVYEKQLLAALDAAMEAEKRKRASLEKEAAAAADAQALGKWATLVTSNLYRIPSDATTAVVEDWERGGETVILNFDLKNFSSPKEQAEAAFTRARRLRRGSAVVRALIEKSDSVFSQLEAWRADVELARDEGDELRALHGKILKGFKKMKLKTTVLEPPLGDDKSTSKPKKRAPGWNGRRFTSPSGVPILVGRNRRENEELSIKIAKAPDVWFHVRDAPGAHVVLQLSRATRVSGVKAVAASEKDMQMAADLAAFYSELKTNGKVRVSFTSAKHVSKPSGAPLGAVTMRKEEGTIVGVPDNVSSEAADELSRRNGCNSLHSF
uniref:NFACT RNA-binding domain-containing protein n=1 Tax=Chrysotila carterae TaxID=13221 RepID=A0A7S4FAE2_CHRCT|mmetsp:Transcript_22433/g.48988  ORF Transcript_22433/g.48988 Transcript_22433/m.48988 type:complete len:378 (-) Transcript_22433:35-1168(-)|eukprot:6185146-Pleurochrysis_carterae.AAC.1